MTNRLPIAMPMNELIFVTKMKSSTTKAFRVMRQHFAGEFVPHSARANHAQPSIHTLWKRVHHAVGVVMVPRVNVYRRIAHNIAVMMQRLLRSAQNARGAIAMVIVIFAWSVAVTGIKMKMKKVFARRKKQKVKPNKNLMCVRDDVNHLKIALNVC